MECELEYNVVRDVFIVCTGLLPTSVDILLNLRPNEELFCLRLDVLKSIARKLKQDHDVRSIKLQSNKAGQ